MSLNAYSALACACLIAAADAVAQPVDFAPFEIPSAPGGRAIAAADFNRDGTVDLAQANGESGSITVVLRRNDEGASMTIDTPVGAGPFDLTAADINRDGWPDLVVANADQNSLSLLIGNGTGAFTRTDLPTGDASSPRGARVADMNRDGKPDIVLTTFTTGVVRVLLGNGSGGFTAGPVSTGAAVQPQGLAIGDFNRDGRPDVAAAEDSTTGLRVYIGGTGAFTIRPVAGARNLNVVAAADLDADGWLDLAAASTSRNTVAVFAGTPAGLVFRRTYTVGVSPRGIGIGDIDGDGRPDIVTANRSASSVSVLLADAQAPGRFLAAIDVAAGPGSRALALADLDHDGRLDIATANQYGSSVTVLSNVTTLAKAAYTFSEQFLPVTAPIVDGGPTTIVAADFDRDGRPDLAVRGGGGIVVRLTSGAEVVLPAPEEYAPLYALDLNADSNPDLLAVLTNVGHLGGGMHTRLFVYLGNGRGSFGEAVISESRLSLRCQAGDLNRDARPDLGCIGNDYDANAQFLQTLLGNGDGTFRHGSPAATAGVWDVQLVDVNRDGILDALTLHPQDVEVWWGTPTGAWSAGFRAETGVVHAQEFRAGDLNHDGFVDVVAASIFGELSVLLGEDGAFGEPSVTEPGFSLDNLAPLTDIDHDGHLDVIGYGYPAGRIVRGTGLGTFHDPEGFDFWPPFTVADITGDGLADIVRGYGTHRFRVLVNQRSNVNHRPAVTTASRTVNYQDAIYDCPFLQTSVSDADLHAVTIEWRDPAGRVVGTGTTLELCITTPGAYPYTVTARDGRGGVTTAAATLTLAPAKEIVVYAANSSGDDDVWLTGPWTQIADPTAAAGFRAYDPDQGAPKVQTPRAAPAGSVRIRFIADPSQTYKIWLRLKADRNHWGNDSVWVQFSGATNVNGTPVHRIGTTSGMAINLEECADCGVSGWGWEDDGWGAVNKNGMLLRFPDGGPQELLIQRREDGVSVDQIVLSSERYVTTRPGLAKNDQTILPRTYHVNPH